MIAINLFMIDHFIREMSSREVDFMFLRCMAALQLVEMKQSFVVVAFCVVFGWNERTFHHTVEASKNIRSALSNCGF